MGTVLPTWGVHLWNGLIITSITASLAHMLAHRQPVLRRVTLPLVIGCSVVSFGALHCFNYHEINKQAVLNTVVHQGTAGVVLSWLAIRYGLRYSILAHMLMNSTLFVGELIWGDNDKDKGTTIDCGEYN